MEKCGFSLDYKKKTFTFNSLSTAAEEKKSTKKRKINVTVADTLGIYMYMYILSNTLHYTNL